MTAYPDPLAEFRGEGDAEHQSLIALADSLSELASCVFSVASGEPAEAGGFHREACAAAAGALPPATWEGVALGVLLDYGTHLIQERAT
jgi:hypothetical protein